MCARARVRACALATLWRHFLGHMMSPLNCEVSCAQARACVRGRGADLARKVSPHVKPGRAWDSADCGDVHGRASPQSGEWSRGASNVCGKGVQDRRMERGGGGGGGGGGAVRWGVGKSGEGGGWGGGEKESERTR